MEFELQRSGGYRYSASLRFFMASVRCTGASVCQQRRKRVAEQVRFCERNGLRVIAHLWSKMFHRIAATFTISSVFGSFRVSSSPERPRRTVSAVDNRWIKFRHVTCGGLTGQSFLILVYSRKQLKVPAHSMAKRDYVPLLWVKQELRCGMWKWRKRTAGK